MVLSGLLRLTTDWLFRNFSFFSSFLFWVLVSVTDYCYGLLLRIIATDFATDFATDTDIFLSLPISAFPVGGETTHCALIIQFFPQPDPRLPIPTPSHPVPEVKTP